MISGVVSDDTGDIDTVDDLYDAIGNMLEELSNDMDTESIQGICNLLFNTKSRYSISWIYFMSV